MLTLYLKAHGTNIICCLWGTLGLGFLPHCPLQHLLQLCALSHGKIRCRANTLMVNKRLLRLQKTNSRGFSPELCYCYVLQTAIRLAYVQLYEQEVNVSRITLKRSGWMSRLTSACGG